MITVERYSVSGFKPQVQSHHLSNVYLHLNENDFQKKVLEQVPDHLKYIVKEQHLIHKKFYSDHLDDLQEGLWVFIEGYKNNQSLNHLDKLVPCWKAELPDDIDVYDCNWDKLLKLSDSECKIFGIYIPKRSLIDIQNVRRIKKNGNNTSKTIRY